MRQPVALVAYAADVPFALSITVSSGGVQKVKGTIHARTKTLFPNGRSVHAGIKGDRNTARAELHSILLTDATAAFINVIAQVFVPCVQSRCPAAAAT